MGKYKVILADPPWHYDNTISNGAAENHYLTMKKEDIKRLPVWTLADDDAVLVMWYTSTHAEEAVALAEAWGFDVRTMKGFTWVKFNKGAPDRFNKKLERSEFFDWEDMLDFLNDEVKINGGNYTRANSEDCLIAVRGKGVERLSASVRQIIFSCLGEHSQKPKEIFHRIEELYGDVPRIELFARDAYPGWDSWGNQAPKNAVELRPGEFVTPFNWKDPKSPWNPNNNLQHWQGSVHTESCKHCGAVYQAGTPHTCAVPLVSHKTAHVMHCPKCLLCYASDSVHVCPSSGE